MYKKQKSNQRKLKERFEIALLIDCYINSKRIVNENEEVCTNLTHRNLEMHRRIVHHIEYAVETLHDKERLIIEYEVIRGKRGKWYTSYMTKPTYYRYRDKAYRKFLSIL
ncbi:MAG: hypothetical protein J6S38_06165 [Erysipelotrichaceae bacterium]|nr:hypothetical protein [Erysipelotrichaceae bacterium]MBP5280202.1 hypothetical protein [Erysipelotrichaceae bacterium]